MRNLDLTHAGAISRSDLNSIWPCLILEFLLFRLPVVALDLDLNPVLVEGKWEINERWTLIWETGGAHLGRQARV